MSYSRRPRSTKKKPAPKTPVVKKEPSFQPEVYEGKVLATTDEFVFIDLPGVGKLHLNRTNRPTKYARDQHIFVQVGIKSNGPGVPAVSL